MKFQHKQLYS